MVWQILGSENAAQWVALAIVVCNKYFFGPEQGEGKPLTPSVEWWSGGVALAVEGSSWVLWLGSG